MNAVFFDLETGGLDERVHPVIQFAGVHVDYAWHETEALELKIKFDEATADPAALAMNHYNREVWEQHAVDKAVAVARIAGFFDRHRSIQLNGKKAPHKPYWVAKLAGHNASGFDIRFLQAMFNSVRQPGSQYGVFMPADPRVRDTLQWAFYHFDRRGIPLTSYRLGALCEYFGIPTPEGEALHDALTDVRQNVKLAKVLMEAV